MRRGGKGEKRWGNRIETTERVTVAQKVCWVQLTPYCAAALKEINLRLLNPRSCTTQRHQSSFSFGACETKVLYGFMRHIAFTTMIPTAINRRPGAGSPAIKSRPLRVTGSEKPVMDLHAFAAEQNQTDDSDFLSGPHLELSCGLCIRSSFQNLNE